MDPLYPQLVAEQKMVDQALQNYAQSQNGPSVNWTECARIKYEVAFSNLEELRRHKPEILAIAARNGISDIRVFGSVARGEADARSDIDLLVRVGEEVGVEFFSFNAELEALLGSHVDVVAEDAINRHME